MALVNNVKELQELLEVLELPITTIDDLRDLLQTVQQPEGAEVGPRPERMSFRERQQAAADIARDQGHAERMRALELGYSPAQAELLQAQAAVLRTAAHVAGWFGGLITLGALGVAVGTTALVMREGTLYLVAVLGILWGVCGLVALVTALVSLKVVRRARLEMAALAEKPKTAETGITVLPERKTLNDNKTLAESEV